MNPPRCIRCGEVFAGARACVEGGACTMGEPGSAAPDVRQVAAELTRRASDLHATARNLRALAEAVERAVAAVDRGDMPPEALVSNPAVAEARRWVGR